MQEFAYPLPARVICELLGVPADQQALFVKHAPALATGLDPAPMRTADSVARANAATTALTDYLNELIEQRTPTDDLLSALISAPRAKDSDSVVTSSSRQGSSSSSRGTKPRPT
ncbi:MAG: hypothetical protein QOK28_2699 [Actinomycetota bacterium]